MNMPLDLSIELFHWVTVHVYWTNELFYWYMANFNGQFNNITNFFSMHKNILLRENKTEACGKGTCGPVTYSPTSILFL